MAPPKMSRADVERQWAEALTRARSQCPKCAAGDEPQRWPGGGWKHLPKRPSGAAAPCEAQQARDEIERLSATLQKL